ncbi:hypothetical protein J6590_005066 [Homalodisca vitripennis]|nr:hypothetical protein J6590_005066 [Homalodisca vitripennis]
MEQDGSQSCEICVGSVGLAYHSPSGCQREHNTESGVSRAFTQTVQYVRAHSTQGLGPASSRSSTEYPGARCKSQADKHSSCVMRDTFTTVYLYFVWSSDRTQTGNRPHRVSLTESLALFYLHPSLPLFFNYVSEEIFVNFDNSCAR